MDASERYWWLIAFGTIPGLLAVLWLIGWGLRAIGVRTW